MTEQAFTDDELAAMTTNELGVLILGGLKYDPVVARQAAAELARRQRRARDQLFGGVE